MNNIHLLQNIVLDKSKVTEVINATDVGDLKQLLRVKDSQASMLRKGHRWPSPDGLLRLMMFHGLKPEDVSTIDGLAK